jgi:hypothetical protein
MPACVRRPSDGKLFKETASSASTAPPGFVGRAAATHPSTQPMLPIRRTLRRNDDTPPGVRVLPIGQQLFEETALPTPVGRV